MRVIFDANFDEIKRISGKTFLDFKRNGHQTQKTNSGEKLFFEGMDVRKGCKEGWGGGLIPSSLDFQKYKNCGKFITVLVK